MFSYIITMPGKSLCKGKRIASPNKCKKVKGCKVASGTKRKFCRKAHNKSAKSSPKNKTRKTHRMSDSHRLNKTQSRTLKMIGY
jgi:hypothetical protein